MVEEVFKDVAAWVALGLEGVSVLIIAVGGVEAAYVSMRRVFSGGATHGLRRQAWLSLARWLLLGLEFMLAADIVRTAVAPTWQDIGQLAAIAVIRTFLNFFLERDFEAAGAPEGSAGEPAPARGRT